MSVFSKIKMSRKAAKEHKGKEAAKAEPAVVVPYKHIPTHAAVDALSGAPSSWKIDDRSKIKAQHKRRSEMSRTGSYLSTVSYGTQNGVRYPQSDNGASSSSRAPAVPQMPAFPRNTNNHSYNAGPAWFDKGDHLDRERYYQNEAPIQKRRKPTRGHSYHDSGLGTSVGPSPLASNIASEDASPETTPVVSSGNSTNSNSSDHLEIATVKRMTQNPNRQSQQQKPQPNIYADQDIFDRLHTSTTRKLGEAPISDSPPVLSKPNPTTAVAVQEQKQKKQRWSLRGKRNSATLAAI